MPPYSTLQPAEMPTVKPYPRRRVTYQKPDGSRGWKHCWLEKQPPSSHFMEIARVYRVDRITRQRIERYFPMIVSSAAALGVAIEVKQYYTIFEMPIDVVTANGSRGSLTRLLAAHGEEITFMKPILNGCSSAHRFKLVGA